MQPVCYTPIGIIHSPFTEPAGMPIQPAGARGVAGQIHLDPAYAGGLADLDGFSHLILLYHFHRVEGFSLTVTPFLDDQSHGLFATRAPRRPNPIGLSVVRLVRVEGTVLHIEDVDVVDGTPLLDVKPYVPAFDAPPAERCGWLEQNAARTGQARADERFGPQAEL